MADITNGKKLINAEGLLTAATALKQYTDQEAKTLQDQLDVIKGEGDGSIKKAVADLKATHDSEMDAAEERIAELEGKFQGEQSVSSQIAAAKQEALQAVANEAAKAREEEGKLQTAINTLNGNAQTAGSVAKAVKDAVDAEAQARTQADNDLSGRIAAFEANGAKDVAALTERVAANEEDITRLDGADTVQGSVKQQIKAVVDAQAPVDAEQDRRLGVLETAIGQGGALEARVKANEDKLAVVQGADTVEGSIAKAEKDAKAYADQQITALVDSAPDAMNTLNELAKAINDNKGVYDAYIEEHATAMANMKTELQNKINTDVKAEADRAKAEEADIRADFAAADATLKTQLQAEIDADVKVEADRAKGVEQGLDGRIKELETAMGETGSVAQAIEAAVSAEATARQNADATLKSDLQKEIKDEKERAEGEEAKIRSEFADADEALSGRIDDHDLALETLGKWNTVEGTTSTGTFGAIKQYVDAEAKRATSAEGTLETNINNEATARQQADNALQSAIDTLNGNAQTAGSVAKAVADEAALRSKADTDLQSAINTEKTNRENAISGLQTKVVNTFNALNLQFVEQADGQPAIQIILDNGGELGTSELSGQVAVPVMTDGEVNDMLAALGIK